MNMNCKNAFLQIMILTGFFSLMSPPQALAVDVNHLISGDIGSIEKNFIYGKPVPFGDEVVLAWDLISKPNVPIDGPWGEKTGLYVPAPYEKYGLARRASQPTTYLQILGSQVGMCLDVQADEIPHQTYNPNIKFCYTWKKDLYPGNTGTKTWLYPFHTAYQSSDPRLQCTFHAAIKTSTGTGARYSNMAFRWQDEESETALYVQYYVYDCRGQSTKPVMSGVDAKIKKLWIAQKIGAYKTFHSILPDSAVYSGNTRSDYAWFGIDQPWSQFAEMINYLNQQHGLKMGTDRNKWRLIRVMFNLEMQQKHVGSIGGKVKDVVVRTRY